MQNEGELVAKSMMNLNSSLPQIHYCLKSLYYKVRRIDMLQESLYEDFEFLDYCKGNQGQKIISENTLVMLKTFHNQYADFRMNNPFSDDEIIYFDEKYDLFLMTFLKPAILGLEDDFRKFGHYDFVPLNDSEIQMSLSLDELLVQYKNLHLWAAKHDILIPKCWIEKVE